METQTGIHMFIPWHWTSCETEKEPDGEITVYRCADIKDAKNEPIFHIDMDGYMGLDDATAAFIVRAVNAHQELVDICKEFVARVERGEVRSTYTYNRMKQALAKAKGD